MKYARIEELRQQHPVAAMCPVLEVSERSYHAWRQRPPSLRMQENLRLETEIKTAHQHLRTASVVIRFGRSWYPGERLSHQADSHETRAALQAEAEI